MPRTALFSASAGQSAVRTAEVRSASDSGVIYPLVKYPGQMWRHADESCKGFNYRQHCRHTEEMEARDQHDAHVAG